MLKQLEEREIRIDEYTFHVTPFPAFKAARISGELTPVLAPIITALAPLIGELTKNENGEEGKNENGEERSIWDIDISVAASKLNGFAISGDAIENVARTLLLGGHIVAENVPRDDGTVGRNVLTEDVVNEIFCGGLEGLYMLCWEVIKMNFGGFFQKKTAQSGAGNMSQTPVSRHRIL